MSNPRHKTSDLTGAERFGFLENVGDYAPLPEGAGGGIILSARSAPVQIRISYGVGPTSARRQVSLPTGSDLWLRAETVARLELEAVGTGGRVDWSWSPDAPPTGDGAALLSAPIAVGALTPVPAGAYEVEIYRSGAGTWTWTNNYAAPVTGPATAIPTPPPRWYVGGSHYTSTVGGLAVWRLRSV